MKTGLLTYCQLGLNLDELTARRVERTRLRPQRLSEREIALIAANIDEIVALAANGDTRFGTFGVVQCRS